MLLCGVDIGGTKCALTLGETKPDGQISLVAKEKFETGAPKPTLERFAVLAEKLSDGRKIGAVGISCGSPLDSKSGMILSPPNLPGWDEVRAVSYFREKLGVPTTIQNDANACAYAEYRFGAGRGFQNVIFLTFGTGFGAGLILDGRLYSGTNDNAGEVGHVRLEKQGPIGYGKFGSAEGFCSGGGIALLAKEMTKQKLQNGETVSFCRDASELETITAKLVADYAHDGDEFAKSIYRISGQKLGMVLSILVDVLNPERIIIGSIFTRSRDLLWPECEKVLKSEALPGALSVCEVVTSELGENIGDYAALSVAKMAYEQSGRKEI